MLKDPWIPILLGFSLALMGSLVSLVLLPETLIHKSSSDREMHNAPFASKIRLSDFRQLWNRVLQIWELFRKYIISIFAIKSAALLLFGFFAASVGNLASGFELQYVHKRFGWSYAYVSLDKPATSGVD